MVIRLLVFGCAVFGDAPHDVKRKRKVKPKSKLFFKPETNGVFGVALAVALVGRLGSLWSVVSGSL